MATTSATVRPSEGVNGRAKLPTFDILLHLDKLTPDNGSCGPGEQSYYCPICNSGNLKINTDGKNQGKWSTWGCDCAKSEKGKQAIKDAIAPLTWDKPSREKRSVTYTYHGQYDGMPIAIAQVRRADDGNGKRKFSQWHRDGNKWVTGLPDGVKAEVHLYQIFDTRNQSAIANGLPILIVEGEGKVDSLLALGIAATCSIGGAGKWTQYGYPNYLKDLEGAAVVICPDRDEPGIKHAELIAEDFPSAKWLYPNPSSFLWTREIPKNKGFDIGDWIEDGATVDDILGAIGEKRAIGVPVLVDVPVVALDKPEPKEDRDEEDKPKMLREYELIKKRFGTDLRYNELFKRVEFQGEAFELTMAKPIFTIHHRANIKSAREDVADITMIVAKENSYSPVCEYLDSVAARWGDDTSILNNAAARYLGGTKPIYDICLMKWLISAVARAYQPGIKADNVLILQGGQGVGKSSFFAILASRPWFDDSFGSSSDKDERIKLHRTWIVEWAEIEATFKRREVGAIKNFITTQTDVLRPPYGREPKPLDRPSVFCGSTNQQEFLADETGNRRYWIIPVKQKVPFQELIKDRDQIWAAAVALKKAGVPWELTDSEKAEMQTEQEDYAFSDTWYDDVADFIEGREFISISDILEKRFNLTKLQQDAKVQFRIKRILSKAGWEPLRNPIWVEGVKKRVWKNKSFI